MLEKGKISPRQAGELMFITIMATVILFVPAITSELAGHDAWIASPAGSLFGLVTVLLVFILGIRYPGRTIFQYSEDILGRFLGKLVALSFVWFFLHLAATVVRQFGDFLTTSFLPETPLSVFNFTLIFLAAIAVLSGLEVIARMNEFIILLVVSSLLAIFSLSISIWEIENLFPVFASGIIPIARGAIVPAAWHGEIVALAVIMPFLTRPRGALVSGAAAVLGSTALLTTALIAVQSVFGPDFTASMHFPIHLFVRSINIGRILTRFEVVIMIIWVAGVFIKTSVFYYCAALGIAQVFGLSEYRPVVLSLGLIIAVFSITLYSDVAELAHFLRDAWPVYSISMYSLGLPLLLLSVSLVRGKLSGEAQGKDKQDG
ncbi:MAG: endospore germination permease [Dethiobacter sp.]|jgi:spore germination protein KB|nr:endospore germination permease [Dethiobacter sp.]